MFGSLGVPELVLIFVVILIVFGPRRIPEIGRTLGKALGEFRKATDDLKSTIEREVRLEELKKITPPLVTPFESVATTLDSLARTEPFPTPPAQAAEPARETTEPAVAAADDSSPAGEPASPAGTEKA